MKRAVAAWAVSLLAVGLTVGSASAASYEWRENDNLQSQLDNNVTFGQVGNVWTLTYTNQSFTNLGGAESNVGMYLGWAWAATVDTKDDADWSGYTPLTWDNARQAFYNADFGGTGKEVALTVSASVPVSYLSLATVGDAVGAGPGWTGTPYSYAPGAPFVTTDAGMNVPFLQFGAMGAGQVKTYDITFTLTFGDVASANAFQDFYVSGQGVSAVPVPAAVWGGLALLGVGLGRRVRGS